MAWLKSTGGSHYRRVVLGDIPTIRAGSLRLVAILGQPLSTPFT